MRFSLPIVIFACLVSIHSTAQSSANKYSYSTRFLSASDTSCDGYYIKLANKDIENGHVTLLESSSLPEVTFVTNRDLVVEKKYRKQYRIDYEEFGCTLPDNFNCLDNYNKTVFKYLDSTYGKKWRHRVNRHVMGYKFIHHNKH